VSIPLARRFKPYGKKRGHRRSGSRAAGSLGELAFFSVLLVGGIGSLLILALTVLVPEWRANHDFVETVCTVVATRVDDSTNKEQVGEKDAGNVGYRPLVEVRYEVDGQSYEESTYDVNTLEEVSYTSDRDEAEAALAAFTPGEQYPCWYDPLDPHRVVVVRGYSWWFWLLLLTPSALALIGGGGLLLALRNWDKSPERRAASGEHTLATSGVEPGPSQRADERFPSLPDVDDVTNSPGTVLAYRLPISTSPGWKLLGAVLVTVFWNGVVAAFVVAAVNRHLEGRPSLLLDLSLVPFIAGGIALIWYLLRIVWITTAVGPTLLEISDHPIHPGREYEILLSQSGRLRVRRLSVSLTCHEEATYRQGTDTRTERRRIFEQTIFDESQIEVVPGLPCERRFRVEIPARAMHSFRAGNNEIRWQLVVSGEPVRWPRFQRGFPVIVYPPRRTENSD